MKHLLMVFDTNAQNHREYEKAVKQYVSDRLMLDTLDNVDRVPKYLNLCSDRVSAVACTQSIFHQCADPTRLMTSIRAVYDGPIIAVSADSEIRQMMRAWGCTHECSNPAHLVLDVCQLLELACPDLVPA